MSLTKEQATIAKLREALSQVIFDTEEGSASDACQEVIGTAEAALNTSQELWLREIQHDLEELRVLRAVFSKLQEHCVPRTDGSRPRETLDQMIDLVMTIGAQIFMGVNPDGVRWVSLAEQVDELKAEVASHARYRELVRSNVAEQSWVKDNKRLKDHIEAAATALFDGSKALQTFQPGSEAHKLQAGVDEAHRHLSAALAGK